MNNEHMPESPVVPEEVPEHGPDFWNRLGDAMNDETPQRSTAAATTAGDATSHIPRLTALDGAIGGSNRLDTTRAAPVLAASQGTRARWPLAAAAVALVVLALGFLAVRGPQDPTTTTEIVSAPEAGADAASGGGSGGDEPNAVDPASADDVVQGRVAEAAMDTASDGTAGDDTERDGDAGDETAGEGLASAGDEPSSAVAATTPTPAPPIPDFASASGAVGDPEHLPLDGGVAVDGTYLANWPERRLTWYAVADPATNCASPGHSEILYVNESGITQQMRDPQARFSGEISHFVVNAEQDLAAWVVGCGTQLELFVATLEPTGRIAELTLAWLGEGSMSSALVLWQTNEVSLNAVEPDGTAFAVDYNVVSGLLSRNGGPARIVLEAGAPFERSLTPIAASPDGGLTYWTGTAPPGTLSACTELYGSGQSDTLWLRQGEGQWRLATAGDFPLGTVTAAALDSDALRLAFADVCFGESGRILIGTQLADGRIGDLQELDLTPYVPGYAAQLFWVDDMTLRIETDNTEFGFGTVRFEYRLDQEVIVQLD